MAAFLLLSASVLQTLSFADSVIDFTGSSGFGVDGSSVDAENGEGVYDPKAVATWME